MRKTKTILLCLVIIFTAISCSTTKTNITDYDLIALSKGMRSSDVFNIFTIMPNEILAIDKGEVEIYSHNNNLYASLYLLYYESEKLYFWGYPQDFAKNNDIKLNEIHRKLFVPE